LIRREARNHAHKQDRENKKNRKRDRGLGVGHVGEKELRRRKEGVVHGCAGKIRNGKSWWNFIREL